MNMHLPNLAKFHFMPSINVSSIKELCVFEIYLTAYLHSEILVEFFATSEIRHVRILMSERKK